MSTSSSNVSSADNNNQTQKSIEDHNNIAIAESSTSDAVVQEPTKKSQDYEDLFPKLPGAAPTSISGNNSHNFRYQFVYIFVRMFCLHFL